MTIVKCITSDSKIWQRDAFILELAHAATANGQVVIDMIAEGPCCESLGLNEIINILVDKFLYKREQFSIVRTGNLISSSQLKESKINYVENFVSNLDQVPVKVATSSLKKRFGMFIGRSNWIRLGLASFLWNNYQHQCHMTFHYNKQSDFHLANFGLEQFVRRYPDQLQNVAKFLDTVPITFDRIPQYPITVGIKDSSLMPMALLYQDIFCEIVCETFFSGKTFFMTEKILRPMFFKRPFVIQGPKYFLKNLQMLGFKTFSQWWDEGYDQDHHDSRYETITNNIHWIGSQSSDTISSWYDQMQPILEHNYQTLMSLTTKKILTTEFYHD